MQQELQMESKLIQQLTRDESQWTLREDLKNEDDLWNNFFTILQNNNRQVLNDVPLTDNEKASIKAKINHSTFFKAAQDFTALMDSTGSNSNATTLLLEQLVCS